MFNHDRYMFKEVTLEEFAKELKTVGDRANYSARASASFVDSIFDGKPFSVFQASKLAADKPVAHDAGYTAPSSTNISGI